jgi:hypothetical protein
MPTVSALVPRWAVSTLLTTHQSIMCIEEALGVIAWTPQTS